MSLRPRHNCRIANRCQNPTGPRLESCSLEQRRPAHRYLQVLPALRQAQADIQFPGVDASSERVLEYLGQAWQAGESPKVVQVMLHMPGLSSTTIHRRLKLLAAHDLLTLEMNPEDNRIKYVRPTDKAWALFAQRGQIIAQAL